MNKELIFTIIGCTILAIVIFMLDNYVMHL